MTSKLAIAAKQNDTLYTYVAEATDPNTVVEYKWYRDGVQLPSSYNKSTYLLTQADVGHVINENTTITVTTSNSLSTLIEPANGGTGFYVSNVNDVAEGDVTISGITEVIRPGTELTASNTLSDLDGLGAISYQWLRNGKVIPGATTDKYTLTSVDNNKNISVKASYIDGFGAKESVTSISDLISLNAKATGTLSVVGNPVVDTVLTLTDKIKDVNGLGTFSYQWLRDGVAITDAVDSTYKLTSADVNKSISAVASFVDGKGATETVTSLSTTKVYSAGNDTITSTTLLDKLTGGKGTDKFVFSSASNSGITLSTRDTITDFSSTQKDKLDVSGIDANSTNDSVTVSNDAFDFIGSLAFDAPGQLRFDNSTRILYGNTDLDADPEFSVLLTGVKSLTVTDFVL